MAREPQKNDIVLYEPDIVNSGTFRYFGFVTSDPVTYGGDRRVNVFWWTNGLRSNGSGALLSNQDHRSCFMDVSGLTVIGHVSFDPYTDKPSVKVIG